MTLEQVLQVLVMINSVLVFVAMSNQSSDRLTVLMVRWFCLFVFTAFLALD